MTDTDSQIEAGSGNVFANLGLEDAEELYTRTALGIQVMRILRERDYSQSAKDNKLAMYQTLQSLIVLLPFWSQLLMSLAITFTHQFRHTVNQHLLL